MKGKQLYFQRNKSAYIIPIAPISPTNNRGQYNWLAMDYPSNISFTNPKYPDILLSPSTDVTLTIHI